MNDSDLTKKVCALLGAAPGWAWRPTGPAYGPTEVAVNYGAIKPAPDRAVGVRVYSADDDLVTGLAQRRIQVRHRGGRGDPAGADDLADVTFAVLQGLSRHEGINGIQRIPGGIAPMGVDQNGREERSDSYYVTLDNAEATT